uniref:NADH-ubiquinone oxidoreductase chain 2 n=1 Tax=Monodonta labio TaxID=74046 RepID=A0A650GB02_9VEST|nr:NADH dehydrogenase subunit 2 [Monodonta labio]
MFSLMPFGFLFISVLIFGSILSLSSLHWLSIWAGLEINLMGFIPMLVYRGISRETESGMKYFIIQALGSGLIMAGSLLSFSLLFTWETAPSLKIYVGGTLIIFGLMLKLGSFPFHFWFPSVMAGVSWLSCLLLTTWQKLAPLFLLATITSTWTQMSHATMSFLLLSAGLSSLVGGIGGLNQTQIRALLAYSSIGHIGWMVFCATTSSSALKIYFLVYFLVSICLFFSLWASEKSFFSQTGTSSPPTTKLNETFLIFMLLSLGGMPPLLGFFAKWLAVWSGCSVGSFAALAPLLAGSLISLFYYLTLLFSLTLFSGVSSPTPSAPLLLNLTQPFPPHLTTSFLPTTTFLTASIFTFNLVGGVMIAMALPAFDFF